MGPSVDTRLLCPPDLLQCEKCKFQTPCDAGIALSSPNLCAVARLGWGWDDVPTSHGSMADALGRRDTDQSFKSADVALRQHIEV